MFLAQLQLTDFRNYETLSLSFPPEGVLLRGSNGSGKTNLLEAIHVLCTGRSQRGVRRGTMIRIGRRYAHIAGTFRESGSERSSTASIGMGRDGSLAMQRDGRRIDMLSRWFGAAGVVAVGPDDMRLVQGGPSDRRGFMDMLLSQASPDYLDHLVAYRRNLLNRNRLLARHGDDLHMGICEEGMAEHGAAIMESRRSLGIRLGPFFADFCEKMSIGAETGALEYRPSISDENGGENGNEKSWKDVFLQGLRKTRKRDRDLGFSSIGPHRDDLTIRINDQPAKVLASQGQSRSLALSLRLGSVAYLEELGVGNTLFLVDDVFAELDDARVKRIWPVLQGRGQLFATTPSGRRELDRQLPIMEVKAGKVSVS